MMYNFAIYVHDVKFLSVFNIGFSLWVVNIVNNVIKNKELFLLSIQVLQFLLFIAKHFRFQNISTNTKLRVFYNKSIKILENYKRGSLQKKKIQLKKIKIRYFMREIKKLLKYIRDLKINAKYKTNYEVTNICTRDQIGFSYMNYKPVNINIHCI